MSSTQSGLIGSNYYIEPVANSLKLDGSEDSSQLELNEYEEKWTGDYIFEPTSEQIYAALMPSYATTKMVTALTESFASEHGSRMMAMGNATKNAGEMVDALTLDYNKARQAQITKELLEVVSGAEALKG